MGRLTVLVLGSAAGGGFPQWNCRCATCRLAWVGDARVRPRTQASLAVSADGENWLLINASPDLPQQVRQSKVLHPRSGTRGSPIKAVVLTGAEIDQVAGLLSLREREPLMVCATPATLAALADNAMFGVLAPDVVRRMAVIPGVPLMLPGEVEARVFMVPGKVPLYLEGENPQIASETAANVGVEISARNARLVYSPGAAAVTAAMMERIKRADVVFFDGTLFRDDEMIAREPSCPSMGICPMRRPVLAPVPLAIISSSRKSVPSKNTTSARLIRSIIAAVTAAAPGM